MKVFPEKLAGRLNAGLDPVYLVAGQEPLLIEEACDAVRRAARAAGVDERVVLEVETGFDWQQLTTATETGSLFSSRRLVELRLPTGKPGREGGAALRDWAGQESDDVLLVKCDQWDMSSEKSAWAGALARAGCYVPCWKIKAPQLPGWIGARLKQRGVEAEKNVCAFLARRLEGNLLAAAQEVERLALLSGSGRLEMDEARAAVADSARFDSFRLIQLIMAGQAGAAMRCIRGLKETDTPMPMIVGALAGELKTIARYQVLTRQMPPARAVAEMKLWPSRKQSVADAAARLSPAVIARALARLSDLDAISKSSGKPAFWLELERLCVALADPGHDRRVA